MTLRSICQGKINNNKDLKNKRSCANDSADENGKDK